MTKANEIETAKVKQFSARIMEDYGNTLRGAMLYIGDRLGLFKALAHGQWVTLEELAQQTGYTTRYLREWLGSMVTGNYLAYDPQSRSYRLPAEFVPVLADEDSPYFAGGIIQLSVPFVSMAPKIIEAFRCGGGCPEESFPLETWEGMERMTMPWYKHFLVQHWIPSLDGVKEKLQAGGSVLDFGCGSGLAAIMMAKAFPEAQVYGCDFHAPSIERARANAEAAGVGDRVRFEVSDSDALAGKKFDFVTTFVVIHDATDPQQMMKDLRESTADDGTYLMVELNLSQELHENMNLFGRVMYPQSTLYCMTCSLSHGGEGLGAFMGEDRARQMAEAASFSRFRKVPSEWPPLPALFELRPWRRYPGRPGRRPSDSGCRGRRPARAGWAWRSRLDRTGVQARFGGLFMAPGKTKPRQLRGLLAVWAALSQVEVVVRQLALQAAFFQQVVDDATLGQVGLGHLDAGFLAVILFNAGFVVDLEFFFGFCHDIHSNLWGGNGAPYSDKAVAGKKDFFNRKDRISNS